MAHSNQATVTDNVMLHFQRNVRRPFSGLPLWQGVLRLSTANWKDIFARLWHNPINQPIRFYIFLHCIEQNIVRKRIRSVLESKTNTILAIWNWSKMYLSWLVKLNVLKILGKISSKSSKLYNRQICKFWFTVNFEMTNLTNADIFLEFND